MIDKADTCKKRSAGEGAADFLMVLGRGGGKKGLIVWPSKHEYNIIKNKYLAKWQSPRLSP